MSNVFASSCQLTFHFLSQLIAAVSDRLPQFLLTFYCDKIHDSINRSGTRPNRMDSATC